MFCLYIENFSSIIKFTLIFFVFFFSCFFVAISREEDGHNNRSGHGQNHVALNDCFTSDEYLDRLEPNGNIPSDKSGFGKRK